MVDNIIIKVYFFCMVLLYFVFCGNGVYNDIFNIFEYGVNILIGVDVLCRFFVIFCNFFDVSLVLSYLWVDCWFYVFWILIGGKNIIYYMVGFNVG